MRRRQRCIVIHIHIRFRHRLRRLHRWCIICRLLPLNASSPLIDQQRHAKTRECDTRFHLLTQAERRARRMSIPSLPQLVEATSDILKFRNIRRLGHQFSRLLPKNRKWMHTRFAKPMFTFTSDLSTWNPVMIVHSPKCTHEGNST